jgi:hypothetical protein
MIKEQFKILKDNISMNLGEKRLMKYFEKYW